MSQWVRVAPSVYFHPRYGKLVHSLSSEYSEWWPAGWSRRFGVSLGGSLVVALRNAEREIQRLREVELGAERSRAKALKPGKVAAARELAKGLRRGLVSRKPCELCGASKAHAHHDDYAKPLEVRWLCRSHHMKWHAVNGEGANADVPY
jgi:hypothetical protein